MTPEMWRRAEQECSELRDATPERRRARLDELRAIDPELAATVVQRMFAAGDLQRLDAALRSMATFNPKGALLIQLTFFLNMSMENAAKTVGLAQRTAERKWHTARMWLLQEMSRDS